MNIRDSGLAERIGLWRAQIQAWRGRVTVSGLLVRVLVFTSGAAAIMLSAPQSVRFTLGVVLAVVLPVMATVRPGGAWVWSVLLTALIGYVMGTLTVAKPSLLLACGIGLALYVHHAAAAISAAWRADAAVEASVMRDWVKRLSLVVLVSIFAVCAITVLAGRPLALAPELLLVAGVIGALGVPVAVVFSLSRR